MTNTQIIQDNISTKKLVVLIALAYSLSFLIRMIWVWQFQDNPNFIWDAQLMINTNDGYFFASGVQKELFSMHMTNPRLGDMWQHGLIVFTKFFMDVSPLSLDTAILYIPAIISSLMVVPVMLIFRLYGKTLLGFLAALLASVAWSYYNRTMVGYYDTDMFAVVFPMFILFFLMKSVLDYKLKTIFYASILMIIYPFLYYSGNSILYAMSLVYAGYVLFYHHDKKETYMALILIFSALLPMASLVTSVSPYIYLLQIVFIIIVYFFLKFLQIEKKQLQIIAILIFLIFIFSSNAFDLIFQKVYTYIDTGTATSGLHFYSVHQTVREATSIKFEMFSYRISGSIIGLIISILGYIVLVLRHRSFLLALPFVGVGGFALIGGLRFTVYAVPIAALGAIYLFFVLGELLKNKALRYAFIIIATLAMLYPNIQHIIDYKVPTVLNSIEANELVKLNALADSKDYTLAWWDYGYPIWYYSDTNTLIDGGKNINDNFIISKIMQTSSPVLAANLSRLAVESYAQGVISKREYRKNGEKESDIPSKFKFLNKEGKASHGGELSVANVLFRNQQEDQVNPEVFLEALKSKKYKLPKKTRDIYLYLPYKMLKIFPTVMLFSNLDLNTGKTKRKISFYPTSMRHQEKNLITFMNGIVFDASRGTIHMGTGEKYIQHFITVETTEEGQVKLVTRSYHRIEGEYVVLYMQSYGDFIVMDKKTFKSMYVQMFLLGKYDENLFELVLSSAYNKIYKLKK